MILWRISRWRRRWCWRWSSRGGGCPSCWSCQRGRAAGTRGGTRAGSRGNPSQGRTEPTTGGSTTGILAQHRGFSRVVFLFVSSSQSIDLTKQAITDKLCYFSAASFGIAKLATGRAGIGESYLICRRSLMVTINKLGYKYKRTTLINQTTTWLVFMFYNLELEQRALEQRVEV